MISFENLDIFLKFFAFLTQFFYNRSHITHLERKTINLILVIDNYDSFTFNLVQYIQSVGEDVVVVRNDEVTLEDIKKMDPHSILLSPGPGNPDTAGICLEVVKEFHQDIPLLGVCLGHQIIAQAFGSKVHRASMPMHGKVDVIIHDGKQLFKDIPSPTPVTRYHSLIVDEASLPNTLEISAKTKNGEIMAIRHKHFPVEGVQFHPEAILTENGLQMIQNFFTNIQRIPS